MADVTTLDFLVQGSAPIPYSVRFHRTADIVVATCTCTAGLAGQVCKHRLSLISGVPCEPLIAGMEHLSSVAALIEGTPLERELAAVADAERDLAGSKRRLAEARRRLANAMLGRKPIAQ